MCRGGDGAGVVGSLVIVHGASDLASRFTRSATLSAWSFAGLAIGDRRSGICFTRLVSMVNGIPQVGRAALPNNSPGQALRCRPTLLRGANT